MPKNSLSNLDSNKQQLRYHYYYRQIWKFYRKPVARVSLGLLLTIFTIVFFAAFAIQPTLTTIGELLRKIEDQEQVLDQLLRKSANLHTAQNEYSIIADRLYLVDEALPKETGIEDLVLLIEATAADHDIILSSIRLNQPLEYNDQPPKSSAGIQDLSFSITLEAPFGQIKPFIIDLAQLPRIITIDTIRFTQPQSSSQLRDRNNINLTLNAKAYYGAPQPRN